MNEWGVDERTMQRLQRVGAGFGFQIGDEGVVMDGEMGGRRRVDELVHHGLHVS